MNKSAIHLLIFLLCWQLIASYIANPSSLPGPLVVIDALNRLLHEDLVTHILASCARVFLGFLLAASLATAISITVSCLGNRLVMIDHLLMLVRPVPPIAWAPLAILWWGLGDTPAVSIVFIASFPLMTLGLVDAAIKINRRYVSISREFTNSWLLIIRKIILPSMGYEAFSVYRTGLGVSWAAVIAAELVGAQKGLGYLIQQKRLMLEVESIAAVIICIGVIGATMNIGIIQIEKNLLRARLDF